MRLIVTHEQADFDALASLMAARILDRQALAILPRRLNRNVRAFLTLYRDRLPFVEFGDLPKQKVERLTLVDRQTLPSLKGMTKDMKVHVIDHHTLSEEIDPAWTVHIEEIGATTTLVVECLQDAGIDPDPAMATLMLLGIYEDTGSLSFVGTTARDIRACAWLLESGANLSIASDFLDHPLSTEQRALYERLMDVAETHMIHGLSMVIAATPSGDMVDEVSTLAQRLRDVYDPDGLFLLIDMEHSVQMVARSSTDALDVDQVAKRFGGGGHRRAAAALIKGRSLEDVKLDLMQTLPEVILPSKTVAEIMSRAPKLLQPSSTVSAAADSMRRFGHEGYPVVDDKGGVVGLLTRRAVDRAMVHGMGKSPVSSVMAAGHLVVAPSDTVQHLQRVMVEHDWGQVPVADAETGKIIGIVTRTDLLKTLAPATVGSVEPDMSAELERALPPARLELLRLVTEQAEQRGDALYIVGGFVRDLLLGVASVDFDLVVEGDAIGLATVLMENYGGRVSGHRRFGTAKWRLEADHPVLVDKIGKSAEELAQLPETLDFVSARTEFYTHPTALPSVQSGSIKLDLHRRDFTINTLALRLEGPHRGQLIDHWGGRQDLRQGLIRVLHSLSFIDDTTRAMRAVRLEQRLGFEIEPRTLELLQRALPLLDRVSGERLRHELELVLREDKYPEIMRRLRDLGVLEAIHPALSWDEWLEQRVAEAKTLSPPGAWSLSDSPSWDFLVYALWTARLHESDARAVCSRLRFPASEREKILEANKLRPMLVADEGNGRPSIWVARLDTVQEASLVAAWVGLSEHERARSIIDEYLANWRFVSAKVDGNALRELGLSPGPSFKNILWTLRSAWLDGEVTSAEEEEHLLQKLVAKEMGHGS